MDNFKFAFDFTAPHEWNQRANYTNLPNDPGGPTKFGVTLRAWASQGSLGDINHDGVVDAKDIMLLEEADVEPFYRKKYWDPYWRLVSDDRLAAKLYDMGVNLGPETAVAYLQVALTGLKVDGHIGPLTLAAANSADVDSTLKNLCLLQEIHYRHWVAADARRSNMAAGLQARARDIPKEA